MVLSPWPGVCAALLPPEDGGPDAVALAAGVQQHLTRVSAPARAALRASAAGLDALALGTTGHRLSGLDGTGRARVLRRAESLSAETAQGLQAVKALILLVAGAQMYRSGLEATPPDRPPAREDPPLDDTPSAAWPARSAADVVVVGSGAGGAMAARTLARRGLRVVVAEEGRRFGVDDFRGRDPLERFASLYRDGGATATVGRPPILLPLGRGVGGTTLVNSGTCYRTPERVLRRWRDDAGVDLADPAEFGGYLDEVEATLDVAPVPADIMGRNGELVLAGAAALGWEAGPLRRNAPGCGGCCQCIIGCPRNAKAGVHLNALPQACAAGAQILSEARVEAVLHDRGRVRGVRARRPDGSALVIFAERVVLAAGAVHTPALLRHSGLGGHPGVGRNLAIHPAIGVAGRFEEPVRGWQGVLQSAAVEAFHEQEGILIEATATPPGMGSATLPGVGADLVRELAAADRLATVGALVADRPAGRVTSVGGRPVIRYELAAADAERLFRAVVLMSQLLLAAGATEVLTGLPGDTPARSTADAEAAVAGADPRRLHLAAFHPTGTVAAGADPERHPAEPAGQLRGVRGVWVADASLLPGPPEVNPQMTIMGLSLAVADRISA